MKGTISSFPSSLVEKIRTETNRNRLLETAVALIEGPSPTLSADKVANCLSDMLCNDGFVVERHETNWPEAPPVIVRLDSGKPGRMLQFDGHLDTVHLPFVPPRFEDGILFGSGSSDMKGGIAAFVEALRVLRDTGSLPGGAILLTAHDHHEGPWGDGRQVHALIREGIVGDAVMLPEYLADPRPVAARGMAIFDVTIRREGEPIHEALRAKDTPDVVLAGTQVVNRLHELHARIQEIKSPFAEHDSAFVGMIQAEEIFNQSPVECIVKGTRRWVTPGSTDNVRAEFEAILNKIAQATGTTISHVFTIQGDAYSIPSDAAIINAFQAAHTAVVGRPLMLSAKPFVDDGNTYASTAGIPALTHGPAATGAHTLNEAVSLAELVRVAQVYTLTAVGFCGG
ncbi:M20/M25/M40 family metallo-hydrolase [Chloroflexi bacterium TSY]|nr:M20/M25/M40 family metallo-hydrolase [Chloroflexi bacterium TSY]